MSSPFAPYGTDVSGRYHSAGEGRKRGSGDQVLLTPKAGHDFCGDGFEGLVRQIERAAVGDNLEGFAGRIVHHLAGLAMREMCLEADADFGCDIAVQVVSDLCDEIRTADQ
jgi:hypothetical protein